MQPDGGSEGEERTLAVDLMTMTLLQEKENIDVFCCTGGLTAASRKLPVLIRKNPRISIYLLIATVVLLSFPILHLHNRQIQKLCDCAREKREWESF